MTQPDKVAIVLIILKVSLSKIFKFVDYFFKILYNFKIFRNKKVFNLETIESKQYFRKMNRNSNNIYIIFSESKVNFLQLLKYSKIIDKY